jgi:hypothetical protein
MIIFFIVISFMVIAGTDMPELIKRRNRLDLVIYLIFFVFALVLSLLLALDLPIPNPIMPIEYIIKDILHLNYTN